MKIRFVGLKIFGFGLLYGYIAGFEGCFGKGESRLFIQSVCVKVWVGAYCVVGEQLV